MARDGRQGVSGGGFGAFFPEKFVSGEGEVEFEVSGRGSKTEIARQFRQLADKCDPPDTSSDGVSEQATEVKIDVAYTLPAALRDKGWRVDVYENGDRYRAAAKKDECSFRFSTHGASTWMAWSRAVRIAELIELGLDAELPDPVEPAATENETDVTANDVLDTVTRQLTAAGFVGCDLPPSECACECTCEIDLEGLGESLGNEVAAYYNALKAGGVTQDEAQYLAGDLHNRLWKIALGDED